ncbi:MAG TPA: YHS domain-containing (seleno)protein [Phycisphaerae bacterium]|nr:YHS domain-containing (seleno)protein [Phycisphaerae bacterium]
MLARNIILLTVCFAVGVSPAFAEPPRDFTITAGDQTFKLSDARGKFVALHFLLKTECPFCLKHTRDYVEQGPTIAGVMHIFIKPDDEKDIAAWRERLAEKSPGAPPIYRDQDAALADAYGVPGGYSFHGQTVHYPALILLGPDGKEVFRHVGKSNVDRLSFSAFRETVRKLQAHPEKGEYNLRDQRLAIAGYDPVSYHDAPTPSPSQSSLTSEYRGVIYQFATAINRRKFAADPERYIPAYGGWCATAMAEGDKVEIDPQNFKITDGRLYLFYKGWLGNALKEWNKDEANLRSKADAAWAKMAPHDLRNE